MKIFIVLLIATLASQQVFSSNEQVNAYLKAIEHPYKEVSYIAANNIYDIPLVSDDRLFSTLHARVKESLDNKGKRGFNSEKTAIFLKALSASGNDAYLPTIKRGAKALSDGDKYNNSEPSNSKKALDMFSRFKTWQSVISQIDFDSTEMESQIGSTFLNALQDQNLDIEVRIYILRVLYNYGKVEHPPLYRWIRSEVEQFRDLAQKNKRITDKLFAWKAKTLMSWGINEDKQLLAEIVHPLEKLRKTSQLKHIRHYVEEIDNFSLANEFIKKTRTENPQSTRLVTIWTGLIRSPNSENKLYAIREAFNAHRFDELLLNTVLEDINSSWQTKKDKRSNQYKAWACKYLMASGNDAAISLVRKISKESPIGYVKKHAKRQIKVYKKLGIIDV